MDIRQCRVCKRIFQSYGSNVCDNCTEEMDNAYIKVRNYIYAHPNADILEISTKTEVPEKWILDFLKEERLSLQNKGLVLTCEQCSRPITTGRFCKECAEHLERMISKSAMPGMKTARKDNMDDFQFKRTSKTN